MRRRLKEFLFRTEAILIAVIILAVLLFAVFGTKAYLYLNILIGRDTVVSLEASNDTFSLQHGDEAQVSFTASVLANPFCSVACRGSFEDISRNYTMEMEDFSLRPGIPAVKSFFLKASRTGWGQDLYRYSISCLSRSSLLCHTREAESTRNSLLVVNIEPTPEETSEIAALQDSLNGLVSSFEDVESSLLYIPRLLETLNESIDVENYGDPVKHYSNKKLALSGELESLNELWEDSALADVRESFPGVQEKLGSLKGDIAGVVSSITSDINKNNEIPDKIEEMVAQLSRAANASLNSTLIGRAQVFANNISLAAGLVSQTRLFSEKLRIIDDIQRELTSSISSLEGDIRNELVEKKVSLEISRKEGCIGAGHCGNISAPFRWDSDGIIFSDICEQIASYLPGAKKALEPTDENSSGINTTPAGNESEVIKLLRNAAVSNLIDGLKENAEGGAMAPAGSIKEIRDSLSHKIYENVPNISTEDFFRYKPVPPKVLEMLKQEIPAYCPPLNKTISWDVGGIRRSEIPPFSKVDIPLLFSQLPPQCCVFGGCKPCCVYPACSRETKKSPVLLIHGHAISRDTAADFSLEGFNKLLSALEKDGFLDAGTISAFTKRGTGLSGVILADAPVTFGASYYFDIFEEPENYVVVQAKSENIDTYAVRMKELISLAKEKTGSSKVTLAGFSMGGLVARRYLQIFGGGDVEKLILIGSPNKGITGDVSSYCPLLGERLECRDMHVESLFMRKLNAGKNPEIPVTNIYGAGCPMEDGTGDGIVLAQNAVLPFGKNIQINGTCTSVVGPLHIELLNVEKYPEVYAAVIEALTG